MEDNNEIYEGYMPDDGEKLSGLKYSDSKKVPSFVEAGYGARAANLNVPRTQRLADIVGQSDYGNSIYDEQGFSMGQVENLEDTRANIQPFIDKLGAGIGTFAGKTVTATVGGLGTLFYGVPNAIAEGRFSAIFDNDFNKSLEKVNEDIDDTFKVYASEAERNGSFWDQSLGSAHWWTKSLLGDGMSFTAGAILSAYAMGGIGSAIGAGSKAIGLTGALQKGAVAAGSFIDDAGMAARSLANKSLLGGNLPEFTLNQMQSAGRISKAANTLKGASQAFNGSEKILSLDNAAAWDKLVGGAKQFGGLATRFAVGSMYEGGVEANDFIKQSLDRYKQQYAELNNGVEPTDEQLDEYKLKILPTANTLFAANVALVGASNLAVLPGIFGKGVNETIKSARKNIVMQTVDDVIKPVLKDETLTGFQKATKLAWRAAKPLASEGLMEEGGQNFAKNMALDYVDKHYNPDSAKNTYNMMNSLGNAFNQAYGTIDGWKEIMAGMVIGGFGSPNIKKIGRFEKTEDGKTRWNPLSLDVDKSWWTGGIIGEFQTHRENNKRAQELIDDYNAQDKESAMEYFKQNRSVNQGIAGQISDINHQNTLGGVLDEAAAQGDFFTAKNAEQDKFHSYIKSRVDAGYYETLESELIDPIKEMSDEEFGEAFGYKNMSKQDLAKRKSKTINEAKQSIKDIVDAINFVDSRMSFNLGTEEGRMRRDLNIYSIATSKSVGKRIDQLNDVINNAISDRLVNKADNMTFETPKTVLEAYKFANNIVEAYETKDVSPEELELKEQLESALQDLPKLLRRKEEALELYAVAKDPKAFNNFWKTERVAELIKKRMDEAAEKIAEAQNEEYAEAEKLIDEDVNPETAAKQTGAELTTALKILDNKNKIKEAKKAKSIKNLLSALNKDLPLEHQFKDENELLEELIDIIEDEGSTDEQINAAEALSNQINQLIEEANQPLRKDSDKNLTKEGLIDETDNDRQPSDESDITTNTNNVDEINKDLRKNDGVTETDSDSEKLIDAFNHIAWNNVLYDQSTGQFTYSGIDPKASKLLQDFRKLSVGQKIEFKVNPTAEFPAEDIEHIKIDILINREVVGYVHTTDYIRPDRVATKDDNLARNKEELIKLREAILNGLTETTLEKIGNGRLITAREFGGKRTDNIPTNDALPDKNLVITVANNGEIDKKNLPKNSLILNQKSVEQGKGNNFKNGIFALIPVNKVNDNDVEKISYIAAPLSPQTLKPEQSETITNLVEMSLRNQTGVWINDNQAEFDAISKSIGNQTSYRDELTDQKVEFSPSSLTGLRNVIKLFTYDRVSLKDDLGVDGEAKSTKKIFGINKVKDGSIVVSFGTPKNVTSFKIKQNEAGESQFFIKQAGRSAWEQIESEGFFDSLRADISNHMSQSFFYHNKSLIRTSNLQIPTVENVDGKLSVKFSTKTYPEFLKDNTQTNLRSVDLGDGDYSYTVQRNIVFSTPKVEKIEILEGNVESKWSEELMNLASEQYESQQRPEVREKPKLQQRRGNGKSIERKKPLSDEDLMPNFSEAVEESTEFKTKSKANTLQMDFITFAKMQEPEIKRSLIAMNRNKEIEVKCK